MEYGTRLRTGSGRSRPLYDPRDQWRRRNNRGKGHRDPGLTDRRSCPQPIPTTRPVRLHLQGHRGHDCRDGMRWARHRRQPSCWIERKKRSFPVAAKPERRAPVHRDRLRGSRTIGRWSSLLWGSGFTKDLIFQATHLSSSARSCSRTLKSYCKSTTGIFGSPVAALPSDPEFAATMRLSRSTRCPVARRAFSK